MSTRHVWNRKIVRRDEHGRFSTKIGGYKPAPKIEFTRLPVMPDPSRYFDWSRMYGIHKETIAYKLAKRQERLFQACGVLVLAVSTIAIFLALTVYFVGTVTHDYSGAYDYARGFAHGFAWVILATLLGLMFGKKEEEWRKLASDEYEKN